MTNRVFENVTADDGEVRADLLVQPAINYALLHNRVPVVRRLALTNLTGSPLTGLDVTLELTVAGGPTGAGDSAVVGGSAVTGGSTGADGALAPVWTRHVAGPVPPQASVGWDDFAGFHPDPALLRGTGEAFPVDYRLTVTRPGAPDLRLTAPSLVLAHDEWFNSPALYDSLAAFVQPNTAAVESVLRSAAQILLSRTGSGSLQGYQHGAERAAQIAGAIYEALRQLGIHYRALPASFENTGQKVRGTAAVLESRLGNCVDLSVTYAACLEAAGLRPLIWLTRRHAFAGFLVEEERLSASVVTEANLLVSMVESGKAVPVELTRIGPGAETADFPAAVQDGLGHFRSHLDELLGVTDIHLSHRSGIRPLPSADELRGAAAGAVPAGTGVGPDRGSIELPAGVARTRLAEQATDADAAPVQVDDSPARVQQWKKSLLDLSLRNPLLNLPKRGRGLDLHVPAGALSLLDDLIHGGKRIEVIAQDAISHVHELAGARRAQELDPAMLTDELRSDRRIYGSVTEQRYKNTMRAIQREARTMEQETGSNYLYLTIGTLVHHKSTGGEAHAPLFLLPVRVEGGAGRRPYGIVVDGNEIASANHCLIEWLRVKHGVRISELENPVRDESGIDIPKTLAAINAQLVENRLNYRIDETASLRLLQFATFQMWRDLTDHWPRFLENPVVRHLVDATGATFDDPAATSDDPAATSDDPAATSDDPGGAFDDPAAAFDAAAGHDNKVGGDKVGGGRPDGEVPAFDEATMHLPIPADGSQMRAIAAAERGRSFVLEGPPGTGKSQTITNLIARAVAAGRTVLFVAEKQAALDVVKRRVQQIGLGAFALDLHGRRQSLNAIREQLREALEQQERGDDISWTAVETAYRTRLAPLAGYPELVHARNGAGLSLWSSYEAKLAFGDGPVATVPASYLAAGDQPHQQVEQVLRQFPAAARSARLRRGHPWSISGCRSLSGLHPDALRQLAADLDQVRAALAGQPRLAELIGRLAGPGEIAELLPAARLAARGQLPDRRTTERAADPRWDAAAGQLQAALAQFRQGYTAELATFRPELFTNPEITAWYAEAQAVGKRLFGKGKRRRAIATRLVPYTQTGTPPPPDQVEELLGRLVAARAQAGALYQQAQQLGGLPLPPGWLPTGPDAEPQLATARQATETGRTLLARHPAAWALFDAGLPPEQAALLERLDAAWRAWLGVLRTGPAEFALWAGDLPWWDAWQRDGGGWCAELGSDGLLPLQRWSVVLGYADALGAAGLPGYRDQLLRVEIDADEAEEAYRRGLARTALAERLRAGDLEYFDPVVHDNRIAQFTAAGEQIRAALPERLPTMLVRRRPFSPAERRGRFADFATELRRKRGGRSFRELFQTYPDVVLALTPCVLVSPASAANFLAPGAAKFDLVIFDEASQIRVAEAVGAMGRGSATVIVGDSRQMPPTTVMQASHETEEDREADPTVPEDLESILSEAVESGLPQHWLSWHYRSHDESLIAFSNRFYYDNKLSSLPSPAAAGEGAGGDGAGASGASASGASASGASASGASASGASASGASASGASADGAGGAVRWRRVDGRFDRGGARTNETEARAVLDEIVRRLHDQATAGESIGVVTFNIQQRDLILDLLEDSTDPLVRERLTGGAEPVFVKNLENVQGDERDVVLFSLAFAVDRKTGQLPLNFGPLSQTGGERRLNVAITRARRQVVLFASFDPADIDLTRTAAVGTQHLRAYCEMAAAGLDRLGDLAADRVERRDRVRDEVAAALRDRGHLVKVGHGLSNFTVDIAVRAPGAPRWQVAVMLDGPQWSKRPTVADRDVAPTLLRTIMSWPEVVRFWLPAWVRDREAFLREVDAAVQRATAPVPPAGSERDRQVSAAEPESRAASAGAPGPES